MYKPHSRQNHTLHLIPCTLCKYFCERCVRLTGTYWWKPVTQFSEYASMDTTNILSSHFMIVDKHRFALMWLVYSRNKFFRVGPEKFVLGGTNFRGGLNVTVTKAWLSAKNCHCKLRGSIRNCGDGQASWSRSGSKILCSASSTCRQQEIQFEESNFAGTNFCELVFDCENFSFCLTKIFHYTVGLAACNWYEHLTVKPDCTGCHWTRPF